MLTPAERAQARRVFEESMLRILHKHVPIADVLVEAFAPDATGQQIVVARYKLHTDGQLECFQVLDEVLWPNT